MIIINPSNWSYVQYFQDKYVDKILSIVPFFKNCELTFHSVEEYMELDKSDVPIIEEPELQAFFSYTIKTESDFKAGIVYNATIYEKLGFSSEEIIMSLLHEIGHVMFLFSTNNDGNKQKEEIYADAYACIISNTETLLTVLEKLKDSHMYSDTIIKQLEYRMLFIRNQFYKQIKF